MQLVATGPLCSRKTRYEGLRLLSRYLPSSSLAVVQRGIAQNGSSSQQSLGAAAAVII